MLNLNGSPLQHDTIGGLVDDGQVGGTRIQGGEGLRAAPVGIDRCAVGGISRAYAEIVTRVGCQAREGDRLRAFRHVKGGNRSANEIVGVCSRHILHFIGRGRNA